MTEHSRANEQELTEQLENPSRKRLRACGECDLLLALPPLKAQQKANCPRCNHTITHRHSSPAQQSLVYAITTLIALVLALSFTFISFNSHGISNSINLIETATHLIRHGEMIVSNIVLLTVVVLPIFFLVVIGWLQIGLLTRRKLPYSFFIARMLDYVTPWMMADVFVIGALVSLIKIMGMADIHLGPSFWAFCVYSILLLKTSRSIDKDWMWFSLAGEPASPENCKVGSNAADQGIISCTTCGLLHDAKDEDHANCKRCGSELRTRKRYSIQKTIAFLIAAMVCYIPANVYPIMYTVSLGQESPSTIISGVLLFLGHGDWPIALVIFTASIVIPISKILALIWLVYVSERGGDPEHRVRRTNLYRVTEFIGRWSMIDVFVVSILVALVQGGQLVAVNPGPAALAFALVVILTMLAAHSFDPRHLWKKSAEKTSRSKRFSSPPFASRDKTHV